MTFLRNAWYAAAWAADVPVDAPVSRTLLGQNLVLFRGEDGSVGAFPDRCPHRYAPLSLGKVEAGRLVCGYHGLTFETSGRCTGSPLSQKAPPNTQLEPLPVVERHRMVWVWMGQVAMADTALVPEFTFLDSTEMPIVTGMTAMKADYRLSIDNLMDLSHIEFVHTGTFGGRGIIKDSVYEVVEAPDGIEARWTMNDIPPPRAGLGADRVDHWLHMRWQAPSSLLLEVGYKPAGAGDRSSRRDFQAHILTPTTGVSSLYFWAAHARIAAKPGDPHDPDRNDLRTAFDVEDKPMIEAVQRNIGNRDLFENKLAFLPYDRGAVRVRQRLQALIAQEQDGESSGDVVGDAARRSTLSGER